MVGSDEQWADVPWQFIPNRHVALIFEKAGADIGLFQHLNMWNPRDFGWVAFGGKAESPRHNGEFAVDRGVLRLILSPRRDVPFNVLGGEFRRSNFSEERSQVILQPALYVGQRISVGRQVVLDDILKEFCQTNPLGA
jgi:hypothetical protein